MQFVTISELTFMCRYVVSEYFNTLILGSEVCTFVGPQDDSRNENWPSKDFEFDTPDVSELQSEHFLSYRK